MKKFIISFITWLIVAVFFYAAIWTNENSSLSENWAMTGGVAFFQVMLTTMWYVYISENWKQK